jgi:predicted phosphodiesterase
MQYWTSEEIEFLQKGLNLSTKQLYLEFCDEYGSDRSYDSVQKKVKKLRDAHSNEPDDEGDQTVEQQVENLLQDPIKDSDLHVPFVTNTLKREAREQAQLWLQGVVELSDEMKDRLHYNGSRQIVNSDQTSLCVLLSDTHYGKHTKWFNLETARERMASIPQRIQQAALPEIDEVVVILAGDMVEGEDIYPTQNSHVECPAIDQVKACSESIWQSLLIYRELFKCPVRVETVPGNHGRVSKSANEKTNWDNVVYHLLRLMASMHGDDDLIVNCNFEPFRTFRVKDKTGMAFHHGVKHTGTPAMREKVAGWTSRKNFDFMVHGHWHEWHVGNWLGKFVIANGCMCGPDDLAERMGKEDDARQAYFLVTPGQPVHGFSFVDWKLEDQQAVC